MGIFLTAGGIIVADVVGAGILAIAFCIGYEVGLYPGINRRSFSCWLAMFTFPWSCGEFGCFAQHAFGTRTLYRICFKVPLQKPLHGNDVWWFGSPAFARNHSSWVWWSSIWWVLERAWVCYSIIITYAFLSGWFMQHYCLYPSRGNGSTHGLLAILGLAQSRRERSGDGFCSLNAKVQISQWLTLPETNSSPMEMPIFPGKYHQKW